jgi:hypothetical protein
MSPDPKDLSFADAHMQVVFWLFVLSACCFLPWLLMAHFRIGLASATPLASRWFLLALPWLLVAVAWFIDPGNYVEWFLD